MSRTHATDRAEALPHKIPIHLSREPHQRMAWIDELLQGRLKQIVLTIVARLAHGLPPTANLAVEGIMSGQNRESQNARKPPPAPSFLAKSNTCSGQIRPIDQASRNSSRATTNRRSAVVPLSLSLSLPHKGGGNAVAPLCPTADQHSCRCVHTLARKRGPSAKIASLEDAGSPLSR